MHPTSVYPIIIFFLSTTVTVSASSSSSSSSIVWTLKHAPIPDDALCSTFSGINSSCSACISNGCSYCHGTCMSIITECLNSPIAQLITLTSCNTIEEHPSVQSNSIHSHHTQSQSQSQSNTTYVPVILSMMGMMIACMIGAIYTRRSYASYKQHTHTSGAKLSQQQHDTDLETSIATIPMMDGDGLSIPLLTMPLSNMSWKDHIITSCTSASGTCYKIIFYLILFIITSLSITTLLTDMWSIHVNGSIWNASSKVIWGGYGITTISHYNDQFITTYSPYQCDDVTLPEYYRCSSHRTLTSITRGITFLAFLSLLVVVFYLITSILCCRSLSSHVIQFQAWTCLLHTTATLIYVTGPFLLQMNMNLSYRLILGPTWYICLIAALLNGCMLIPMTIRTIPAPSSSPSTCCQDPSDIIYDDIPMKSTPTADPDPIYVDMDEPVPIKTIIINVVLDKHRHED